MSGVGLLALWKEKKVRMVILTADTVILTLVYNRRSPVHKYLLTVLLRQSMSLLMTICYLHV